MKQRSDREVVLLNLGVQLVPSTSGAIPILDAIAGDTSLAFSGYGEFTPITVRSDTVLEDAHVERDQR